MAPPQHDTLRCFLDVDSFQGGSFNLSENISDLISFMFYRLNSPQGRRLSCVLWLQWFVTVYRLPIRLPAKSALTWPVV